LKIKITIDTKEDSHEEIRRIIRMLSSLVGEKEVFENKRNVFENSDTPQNVFGNIFDNNQQENKEEPKEDTVESTEDEKTEVPQVMEYD